MQRYNITPGTMCPNSEGYWVRWEEVKHLAEENARLDMENRVRIQHGEENKQLKKEIRELKVKLNADENPCCHIDWQMRKRDATIRELKAENKQLKIENSQFGKQSDWRHLGKENEELKKEIAKLKEMISCLVI